MFEPSTEGQSVFWDETFTFLSGRAAKGGHVWLETFPFDIQNGDFL